jgi:nicotinate dehydrogenase subunit B
MKTGTLAEVARVSGPRRGVSKTDALLSRGWSRRNFLKSFTGGLAVLWLINRGDLRAQAETGKSGRGGRGGNRRPRELAAWLHIAADGTVTVFSGKAEVGQNVRTMLTQSVAEELPTALAAITIVLADTSLVPWDAGTSGSRSTPDMVPQVRRAAATAREALIDLAAKQWGVDRNSLTAVDGRITHPATRRSLGYGELTKGEKLVLDVSESIVLKPATAWQVMGTTVWKVAGRSYVTGRHVYSSDVSLPGLVHGRVLRPAAFGASLVSLDTSAAEAMPGVTVVRDGDFAGATAPTEHLAAQAVAAMRAEWKTSPQISDRELFAHLRSTARNAPAAAAASVPGELRQTYTVAYIAHAPLEPRAAVAEWKDGLLTVWTGTQRPFGVRSDIAAALRVPEDKVRVIVPDTG